MATVSDRTRDVGEFESTQAACLKAMGILASGRAWLVFLISLAILAQVGLFAAANWGDVLQLRLAQPSTATAAPTGTVVAGGIVVTDAIALPPAAGAGEPLAPGDAAAASQPAGPDVVIAEPAPPEPQLNVLQTFWPAAKWEQVMKLVLPVAGFVGLVCAGVLILLTIVGIQVNVVGRLPAIATMISAFYWSVIAAALLFPWGSLINESLGQMGDRIPWMFFSYREIARAVAAGGDEAVQALIWLRFLAWPVVGLLAAWMAGGRFGKAYWHVAGLAEFEPAPRPRRREPVREM